LISCPREVASPPSRRARSSFPFTPIFKQSVICLRLAQKSEHLKHVKCRFSRTATRWCSVRTCCQHNPPLNSCQKKNFTWDAPFWSQSVPTLRWLASPPVERETQRLIFTPLELTLDTFRNPAALAAARTCVDLRERCARNDLTLGRPSDGGCLRLQLLLTLWKTLPSR
jgi:hypothetical protein